MLYNIFCNGRVLMVFFLALLFSRMSEQFNYFIFSPEEPVSCRAVDRIPSLLHTTLSFCFCSPGANAEPSQCIFAHELQ